MRPLATNVLLTFVLSPAARAAAYILAEALLLLLRALASNTPDLPAETAAALQRNLEHLVHRLRHVAQTGADLADHNQPAPLIAIHIAATTCPPQPRRSRLTQRPRPHPLRRSAHNAIRQPTALQTNTRSHV